MFPHWIIEKKRDGGTLTADEIRYFISANTKGEIPDYQMSALAMAIYFQGMNFEETSVLTEVMMNSGDIVNTSSLKLPKVDKHSTGGVGDKTSLVLAPLVACCGAVVPMISGRGLGITGGTLDKLESIPGYRVSLSEREFLSVLNECGCSICGQTAQLAPADKKLYALRDVTGTVPSIPLITASILCKKLAEGIDALVLDVKVGSGAAMKDLKQAEALGDMMVKVGRAMGKDVQAVITDMSEPLGCCVGNALEVLECVEVLKGRGPADLIEVTMELGVRMLLLARLAVTKEEARAKLATELSSGRALERFRRMIALQGGDPAFIDDYSKLPRATLREDLRALSSGRVAAVDAEKIGRAAILLGAGRGKIDDKIDFAVGFSDIVKRGAQVVVGDRLLTIHANSQEKLQQARDLLNSAITISEGDWSLTRLIHKYIE